MKEILTEWRKFLTESAKILNIAAPRGFDISQNWLYQTQNFDSIKATFLKYITNDFKEYLENKNIDINKSIDQLVSNLLKMCKELLTVKSQILINKHLSQQSLIAYDKLLSEIINIKDAKNRNIIIEEIKKFITNEANKIKIVLSVLEEGNRGEFDPKYPDRIFISLYYGLSSYMDNNLNINNSVILNTFSHEFSHMIDKKIKNFIVNVIQKKKIPNDLGKTFKKADAFSSYLFYDLDEDFAQMLNPFYKEINNENIDVNTIQKKYDLDENEISQYKQNLKYLLDTPEIYVRVKKVQQLINPTSGIINYEQVIDLLNSGQLEKYPDVYSLIKKLDFKNPDNVKKFTEILNTVAKVETPQEFSQVRANV